MEGYASREAALDILLEQETTGAFLKELFGRHTEGLQKQDRGLVREIALGVIRNLSLLDHNIHLYASRKPGRGALRAILRLTAYQLFFMDVPGFAAVNVGVELAKHRESRHQGGFVNAVLKKMAAAGMQKVPGGGIRSLAVNYSHPEWLLKRWYRRLGGDGMLRALERNNQEAPLWIRVNPAKAAPGTAKATPKTAKVAPKAGIEPAGAGEAAVEAVRAGLAALGVETERDGYARPYLRIVSRGGAEAALHSDLFAAGAFAFQDPAAWFIAELADWSPGEALLDLCSAPGGKAACLTERAGYLGRPAAGPAVCNDVSFRRLRRIGDAIHRLGHGNLLPVVMDASRPALRAGFPLVVVDAPCSNLGVLRRRPEARWSHSPADLDRLAQAQGGLLDQASALAAPSGRILYATCSPEEEETWSVVEAFLARHREWRLADAGERLPAWAVKRGCLWLHPGESEYDGFFAARLERGAAPLPEAT